MVGGGGLRWGSVGHLGGTGEGRSCFGPHCLESERGWGLRHLRLDDTPMSLVAMSAFAGWPQLAGS